MSTVANSVVWVLCLIVDNEVGVFFFLSSYLYPCAVVLYSAVYMFLLQLIIVCGGLIGEGFSTKDMSLVRHLLFQAEQMSRKEHLMRASMDTA